MNAFVDDVAGAYAWADLVVCRAGRALWRSSLRPAPHRSSCPIRSRADDHQSANARFFAERGAGRLVPDTDELVSRLAYRLGECAADRSACLAMAEAARRIGWRDAAERVAACCRKFEGPRVMSGRREKAA